jgi:hypothetical protein
MTVQKTTPVKAHAGHQNRMSSDRQALIREVRARVKSRGYDIVEIARDLLRVSPTPSAGA